MNYSKFSLQNETYTLYSELNSSLQNVCRIFHILKIYKMMPFWNLFMGRPSYVCRKMIVIRQLSDIKELLCVKYGLIPLPLFDVSQIDFMLESLCTQQLFLPTFYLYFLYTISN